MSGEIRNSGEHPVIPHDQQNNVTKNNRFKWISTVKSGASKAADSKVLIVALLIIGFLGLGVFGAGLTGYFAHMHALPTALAKFHSLGAMSNPVSISMMSVGGVMTASGMLGIFLLARKLYKNHQQKVETDKKTQEGDDAKFEALWQAANDHHNQVQKIQAEKEAQEFKRNSLGRIPPALQTYVNGLPNGQYRIFQQSNGKYTIVQPSDRLNNSTNYTVVGSENGLYYHVPNLRADQVSKHLPQEE